MAQGLGGYDELFIVATNGSGMLLAINFDGNVIAEHQLPDYDHDNPEASAAATKEAIHKVVDDAMETLEIDQL